MLLPVYEQQTNHSYLDIPQVLFHSEQRDPAGKSSVPLTSVPYYDVWYLL